MVKTTARKGRCHPLPAHRELATDLSTATVPPTPSLNIMVIELPIFSSGPLSNLSSFSVAVALLCGNTQIISAEGGTSLLTNRTSMIGLCQAGTTR